MNLRGQQSEEDVDDAEVVVRILEQAAAMIRKDHRKRKKHMLLSLEVPCGERGTRIIGVAVSQLRDHGWPKTTAVINKEDGRPTIRIRI